MKIKGTFLVKNQFGKIISYGQNTITNKGKQLILKWLAHDNYKYCENNIFNGKSLSSQRFLPYNEMICDSDSATQSVNSDLINCIKNFDKNRDGDDYFVLTTDKSIYIQVKNGTIDLSGLFFYGYFYNDSYGNFDSNNANPYFSIYTSSDQKSTAISQNSWIKQKNFIMPWNNNLSNIYKFEGNEITENNYYKNCKVIRFDNHVDVDKIIDDVKTIKITYNHSDTTNNCNFILRGLGILKGEPYNNPPCVIGLGNGEDIPDVSDTNLKGDDIIKVFVNKNKYIEDENFYKIIYMSRLNRDQFNGKQFKQIGLFYNNGQQINYNDSTDNIENLFSRGLFETSWSKESGKIVDIEYSITISFQ